MEKREPSRPDSSLPLLDDLHRMIEETRQVVAATVNTSLTLLYWRMGKRINEDILKGERAEYGEADCRRTGATIGGRVWPGICEKTSAPHAAVCGGFSRRANCLRTAETIGLDAFQADHLPRRSASSATSTPRCAGSKDGARGRWRRRSTACCSSARRFRRSRTTDPTGTRRPARGGQADARPCLPRSLLARLPWA